MTCSRISHGGLQLASTSIDLIAERKK